MFGNGTKIYSCANLTCVKSHGLCELNSYGYAQCICTDKWTGYKCSVNKTELEIY